MDGQRSDSKDWDSHSSWTHTRLSYWPRRIITASWTEIHNVDKNAGRQKIALIERNAEIQERANKNKTTDYLWRRQAGKQNEGRTDKPHSKQWLLTCFLSSLLLLAPSKPVPAQGSSNYPAPSFVSAAVGLIPANSSPKLQLNWPVLFRLCYRLLPG